MSHTAAVTKSGKSVLQNESSRIVRPDRDFVFAVAILLALSGLPYLLGAAGQTFWLDIVLRAMILGIAAVGVNFIIGLSGMVSLGQGAFVGLGGYSVGILVYYDIQNGWIHLGVTIAASALFAIITGIIALKTRGVHFIMITLAFGQMLYYVAVGTREYGGDDGLTINYASAFGSIDLGGKTTLFYVVLVVLAAAMLAYSRVKHSDFGYLLRAAKGNERRATAIGFDVFSCRLACYVASGILCGLAGFLEANFTSFITPESMSWTSSAELIFMVIVGGVATVSGPIVGALIFLLLEEFLGSLTVYWHFLFGVFLILVVLFARGGVVKLLDRRRTP